MIQAIKKLLSQRVPEVNDIYDQMSRIPTQLNSIPIIDGNYFDGIVLKAGITTSINHGLGQPYKGFIIVKNPNGDVFLDKTVSTQVGSILSLQCVNSTTIAIWVF
jgi:hypothetical protein